MATEKNSSDLEKLLAMQTRIWRVCRGLSNKAHPKSVNAIDSTNQKHFYIICLHVSVRHANTSPIACKQIRLHVKPIEDARCNWNSHLDSHFLNGRFIPSSLHLCERVSLESELSACVGICLQTLPQNWLCEHLAVQRACLCFFVLSFVLNPLTSPLFLLDTISKRTCENVSVLKNPQKCEQTQISVKRIPWTIARENSTRNRGLCHRRYSPESQQANIAKTQELCLISLLWNTGWTTLRYLSMLTATRLPTKKKKNDLPEHDMAQNKRKSNNSCEKNGFCASS